MSNLLDSISLVRELAANASNALRTVNDHLRRSNKSAPTAVALESQCSQMESTLLQLQKTILESSREPLHLQAKTPLAINIGHILGICKITLDALNTRLGGPSSRQSDTPENGKLQSTGNKNEEDMGIILQNLEAQSTALQFFVRVSSTESPTEASQLLNSQQHLQISQIVSEKFGLLGVVGETGHTKQIVGTQSSSANSPHIYSSDESRAASSVDQTSSSSTGALPERNFVEYRGEQGLISTDQQDMGLVKPSTDSNTFERDLPRWFQSGFKPLGAGNQSENRQVGQIPPLSASQNEVNAAQTAPQLYVAESAERIDPELYQDRTSEEAYLRDYAFEGKQPSRMEDEERLGTSKATGSRVVIKRVPKADKQKTVDARREIKVLGAVSDPCVAALIDWQEFNSSILLVLEHKPGDTLSQLIRAHGPPPEWMTKSITTQLFSTVLIDNQSRLIITGFQYMHEYGHEKVDDQYALLEAKYGSDIYVAPEVFASRTYNARKAVLWSCGVLLYYVTTGQTEKLASLGHPSFEPEMRGDTTSAPNSHRRKLSVASQQLPKIVSYPSRLAVTTWARDIISKMLLIDPLRRAELIEVAAKVPKEIALKETRPLMELAWLDYKTHVGPLAGLDAPPPRGSSASSIYSAVSNISNPFSGLLSGRRKSSSNQYYESRNVYQPRRQTIAAPPARTQGKPGFGFAG